MFSKCVYLILQKLIFHYKCKSVGELNVEINENKCCYDKKKIQNPKSKLHESWGSVQILLNGYYWTLWKTLIWRNKIKYSYRQYNMLTIKYIINTLY